MNVKHFINIEQTQNLGHRLIGQQVEVQGLDRASLAALPFSLIYFISPWFDITCLLSISSLLTSQLKKRSTEDYIYVVIINLMAVCGLLGNIAIIRRIFNAKNIIATRNLFLLQTIFSMSVILTKTPLDTGALMVDNWRSSNLVCRLSMSWLYMSTGIMISVNSVLEIDRAIAIISPFHRIQFQATAH